MREKVIASVEENKIIAILRGIPSDKLIDTAEALYRGGIRLLEITYSANGSISDEETAANIKKLSEHFDGRMFIGAGTVMTKKQVRLTEKAGGRFIISPNTDKSIIKETIKRGLVSVPGALTPTEIADAHKFGADFVKLFPITNLGIDYVKAVMAPLSNVKLLAVGGIDEGNMEEYLKIGVYGFGISSSLTNKEYIKNGNWDEIAAIAEKCTTVIKNA